MPVSLLEVKIVSLASLHALAAAGTLYAVLDACDAPSVPPRMGELGEDRAVSLYRGLAEEEYSSFAPYLAIVDGELLEWIFTMPAREPWGIFVHSSEPLDALRLHFRHFLIVSDPHGEPMYFRFYDPRVLRKFLPTCTAEELGAFYGMIAAFLVPDSKKDEQILKMVRAPHLAPPAHVTHSIGQRFMIRPPQMEAFGAEADHAFEARLAEHLQDYHGDLVAPFPDDILAELARRGIARARRYKLFSEADLTAFVGIMFEIAPNFDQHPYIQNVLTDPRLLPAEKMDALIQRVPDAVWNEAERHYDENAWNVNVAEVN